jgi:uroporphyrinogen-III synthase
MAGLVLVTRPADEAASLAEEIAARGYSVLIEPMLRIVHRDAVLPPLGAYDALAFTSANGVRAFAALSGERAKPVFAVGGATASALRSAGFAAVRDADGDAPALAGVIAAAFDRPARLLHLTGDVVAGDLKGSLAASGIAVDRMVIYDAVAARTLSDALVQALYACTLEAVLLFSARTAGIFGTLATSSGLAEMLRSTTALCLSAAVAAEARRLAWKDVGVAEAKTSHSLLELLPPTD